VIRQVTQRRLGFPASCVGPAVYLRRTDGYLRSSFSTPSSVEVNGGSVHIAAERVTQAASVVHSIVHMVTGSAGDQSHTELI